MTEREDAYLLRGKIQMDDAYLGGELSIGKAGRGSENKIPIVAAVSLNEAGHPIHSRITSVSSFSSECQATSAFDPPLCIIKCYLQLVSRQNWSFPLSASPFRLIASPPVAALLGLFAIP